MNNLDKLLSLDSVKLKSEFARVLLEQAQEKGEIKRNENLDRRFYLTLYSLIQNPDSVSSEEQEEFFSLFRNCVVRSLSIPESLQRAQRNAERQFKQYMRGNTGSGGYRTNNLTDVLSAQTQLIAEEIKQEDELRGRTDLLPFSAVTQEYLYETLQKKVISYLTTPILNKNWVSLLNDMASAGVGITDNNEYNRNFNQYVHKLYSALQRTSLSAILLHQNHEHSFLEQLKTIWDCSRVPQSDFRFFTHIWKGVHSIIEDATKKGLDPRQALSPEELSSFLKSFQAVNKLKEQVEQTYKLATRLERTLEKLDKNELDKEFKLSKLWFSFHNIIEDSKEECTSDFNGEMNAQFKQFENREMNAQFQQFEKGFEIFRNS